jgi:hypothetical protein
VESDPESLGTPDHILEGGGVYRQGLGHAPEDYPLEQGMLEPVQLIDRLQSRLFCLGSKGLTQVIWPDHNPDWYFGGRQTFLDQPQGGSGSLVVEVHDKLYSTQ